MLSLLSGQKNQAPKESNPAFKNYPQEAFSNNQTVSTQSVQPDNMGGIMPLLMQMLGGKSGGLGNLSNIESIMKNGNFDISSLFKTSSKSTKKEGSAPKDDLVL